MPLFLLKWATGIGIPARFQKAAIIGAGVVLLLLAIFAAVKLHDRRVLRDAQTKAELKQVKRERKADANLQQQIGRDDAASQQRKREIEDATRNIPDQAPTARQRAIACAELMRDAKAHGHTHAAC